MFSTSDSYIIITQHKNNFSYFNDKTIFNTLTNEHIIKILILQKIKNSGNVKTSINIFLDNFKLKDFNLNDKVMELLENSDKYHIYFKGINEIDKKKIMNYSDFINKNNK